MRYFEFVKLSNRWFVDVPYDGCVSDLEMVDGADNFLEIHSNGSRVVTVYLSETAKNYSDICSEIDCKYFATFVKIEQDNNGTTYEVKSNRYKGDVWLCPVFNLLVGESPDRMVVGIDDNLG